MTLDELIEQLEEAREDKGGKCPVRLMTQERWPFVNAIHCVTDNTFIEEEGSVVYIVEGQQLDYGNKDAWNAG